MLLWLLHVREVTVHSIDYLLLLLIGAVMVRSIYRIARSMTGACGSCDIKKSCPAHAGILSKNSSQSQCPAAQAMLAHADKALALQHLSRVQQQPTSHKA